MPKKPIIDKEMFKRSVLYNVKTLYRKTLEKRPISGFSGGSICCEGCDCGSLAQDTGGV